MRNTQSWQISLAHFPSWFWGGDVFAHNTSKKQKRSSISMAESKSGPNNKNRVVGGANFTTPAPAAAPLVQAKGNAGYELQKYLSYS